MNELIYQEMLIEKRTRLKGLAELLAPPGPKVTLSAPVAIPFAKSAVVARVSQELRVLRPRIDIAMPPVGGVMVRVGIHQAKMLDEDGKPRQRFVKIEVVGAGRVMSLVVFGVMPRLTRLKRAPAGWASKSLYLWVTR